MLLNDRELVECGYHVKFGEEFLVRKACVEGLNIRDWGLVVNDALVYVASIDTNTNLTDTAVRVVSNYRQ
jgi:hypothetical protein